MSAPYRDTLEPLRERERALSVALDRVRSEVRSTERELSRVKAGLMSVMVPPAPDRIEDWWHWASFGAGVFVGTLLALIQ